MQHEIWDELVSEFPPLWNPRDLNYRDLQVRAQCRQQLLEKCNLLSSIPITMESLMKKLRNVNKRRKRRSRVSQGYSEHTLLTPSQTPEPTRQMAEPTSTNPETTQFRSGKINLKDLVAEYPCLWDPQDINYLDAALKANCEEQLLVKYNNLSNTPITMWQLHKRLRNFRQKLIGRQMRTENQAERRPIWNHRFEELVREFPCLWDPKDPNYRRRSVRDRCLKQLLDKYNSLSSVRINYLQLMKKILLMRRRRKRRGTTGAPPGEDSRADWFSDFGTSSDSTDPVDRIHNNVQSSSNMIQTTMLSIVFHCCAVCGEVKSECLNHNDKPYIENNKTTLTINNLSVELNYDKDATVCQNCDKKLKEMHEFVKLVKNAQDKLNCVHADAMAVHDENLAQNFILDTITVTDTDIGKPTVSDKRKSEETPELKKKCRVTIDLNSCDEDETMDDIAKYRMFNNASATKSKDSDGIFKLIVTEDDEDDKFNVKQEIETEDIIREEIEISTDDDKSNIVCESVSENAVKEFEICKIVKIEDIRNDINGTGDTVAKEIRNDIDESGQTVTGEDKRSDLKNGHENSEIANEAGSVVSAASKEPMCVMPKSELVLLVESIVSRMLNK